MDSHFSPKTVVPLGKLFLNGIKVFQSIYHVIFFTNTRMYLPVNSGRIFLQQNVKDTKKWSFSFVELVNQGLAVISKDIFWCSTSS